VSFFTNPFFWALVSMGGLHGAGLVVSDHRLGRNPVVVTLLLTFVTVGRILLVLPFCQQPRLDLAEWNWVIGGLVLLIALVVAVPTMSVKWWRAPTGGMKLHTTGVYAIVRHPMYLSEVLWPIGWSIMWGSMYGLALAPVWWLGFQIHVLAEEARLEQELGAEYTEYMSKVRSRILPGLRM
jgi:protein-S-isoprenylcysteine O-methyltransferase Ste14